MAKFEKSFICSELSVLRHVSGAGAVMNFKSDLPRSLIFQIGGFF